MNNKTRIILVLVLYFLLCIFDYIFTNTIEWKWNILETVVGIVIAWFVIEFLPNKKK
ncbi:hypothetical protein GCM10008986_19130 [Salinibacillus aidingensis]|uniref:Uncharacterized protein n=1 Tax=Salinibacillus aidingensis TaxID=237684 RepID=A0ABN1BA50_9BACI